MPVEFNFMSLFKSQPNPGAINTFFTSRGRLLKNFWSVLNTATSASSENQLRPPTSPINSGFSLPKKEATVPLFTSSEFSR